MCLSSLVLFSVLLDNVEIYWLLIYGLNVQIGLYVTRCKSEVLELFGN
jgi:hypothetical protein